MHGRKLFVTVAPLRASSIALVLLSSVPVAAQVDEGREALAAAEFQRAIRAFDEAERGSLDRDAYVSLLEGRALASWASGDETRARVDLAALAEVDPEHTLPLEAPPDVTALFAASVAARAGPLTATATLSPAGDRVTVTIENDDAVLVWRVRAHVRSQGGPWTTAEADPPAATFPVPRASNAGAQAFIELIGPGGAVLTTVGSRAAPIAWVPARPRETPSPPEPDVLRPPPASSGGEDDSTTLWIWLGVGGGVAVIAAAILLAVALSGGGVDGAQPTAPMVMGF